MISADYGPKDIKFLALAFHEIMGRLPTTMRTRNQNGVVCLNGMVVDDEYTGPMLERVLSTGEVQRGICPSGKLQGEPLIAVPLKMRGEVVAAVAAVDSSKGRSFAMMHKFRGMGSELSVERCLLEEGEEGNDFSLPPEDLRDLGFTFHELVGRMPLSIRSTEGHGLLFVDGEVVDEDYSGPVLDQVLQEQRTVRTRPSTGRYEGQPLIVVPIMRKCRVLAAVGTIDVTKGEAFAVMHRFRR